MTVDLARYRARLYAKGLAPAVERSAVYSPSSPATAGAGGQVPGASTPRA